MTNANVSAAVEFTGSTGARVLTLEFKGGSQKIMVPSSASLVRAMPGTRADLRVGEYVLLSPSKPPMAASSWRGSRSARAASSPRSEAVAGLTTAAGRCSVKRSEGQ